MTKHLSVLLDLYLCNICAYSCIAPLLLNRDMYLHKQAENYNSIESFPMWQLHEGNAWRENNIEIPEMLWTMQRNILIIISFSVYAKDNNVPSR